MQLDIDFSALAVPSYKEDSVREDIVAPILRFLGFRSDRDPKIVRSQPLTHPYVMLGSQRKPISIVPDYTLYSAGKPRLVLDAKAPRENIIKGEHVAQAYSYAIHPEVRACVYALCNGYQLSLFHIFAADPVRVYDLANMQPLDWQDMKQKMSELEIQRIEAFDFLLDFGTCFELLGLELATPQLFFEMPIMAFGRVSDDHFCMTFKGRFLQDRDVMLTADCSRSQMQAIVSRMGQACRQECVGGLSRQPYHVDISKFGHPVTFSGKLANAVVQSVNGERFRPIVVDKII